MKITAAKADFFCKRDCMYAFHVKERMSFGRSCQLVTAGNYVYPNGCKALAEAIAMSKTLTSLDLACEGRCCCVRAFSLICVLRARSDGYLHMRSSTCKRR
eukprot:2792334-Pleurochrysis_carterae.AAC.5